MMPKQVRVPKTPFAALPRNGYTPVTRIEDPAPPKKVRRGLSDLAAENIRRARPGGLLPHEILLSIARGERQFGYVFNPDKVCSDGSVGGWDQREMYPDLQMRVSASKDAAPYYAPRLGVMEMFGGASDGDLDTAIERLAAEAGVVITISGEGETP